MKGKTKLIVGIAIILMVMVVVFLCIEDKTIKIGGKSTFTLPMHPKQEPVFEDINTVLDSLNIAANNADYKKYFSYFTESATYNGTDATENWDKKSFMTWAKPYFDAKTTWNFKSLKRNIYFGEHTDIAWFDELLSTQMKICRGSGVAVKQDGKWKIQQYVLSMTIPNSQLDKVVKIKMVEEDSILSTLNKSKK